MSTLLSSMLARYKCETRDDYENALKEIIQEFALLGLSRSQFFDHAAFYGGTALRVFYGLDRFSEDLDFSLLKPKKKFDLAPHLASVATELESAGFRPEILSKTKTADSAVESAFIKANTREHLLQIKVPGEIAKRVGRDEALKVKLEVDTEPPSGFTTEVKYLSLPVAFPVRVFLISDLFAGKAHACLCRNWKNRVKGRDWYDLEWYVARKTMLNIEHLLRRMVQSGNWPLGKKLLPADCRKLFTEKISSMDMKQVKSDVEKFIEDPNKIRSWNKQYFLSLVESIQFTKGY